MSSNRWITQSHYSDVIMGAITSQITSLAIVYSAFYSGADQRKQQSSASLAFVWGIHRWPVNSTHKGPVTRKMFPFDDVIMEKTPILFGLGHVERCYLPDSQYFIQWLSADNVNSIPSICGNNKQPFQTRLRVVNSLRPSDTYMRR